MKSARIQRERGMAPERGGYRVQNRIAGSAEAAGVLEIMGPGATCVGFRLLLRSLRESRRAEVIELFLSDV